MFLGFDRGAVVFSSPIVLATDAMNSQLLRPVYCFGAGLLLCSSIGVFSQAAAKEASIATDGPVFLAQASEKSGSPSPAEVQEWLRQVEALGKQGQYQEAALIQEKLLAWMEQHVGPDHPTTATSLNNLAALYVNQGVYTKAEPLYRRALAIKEKALGHDHVSTAATINNLAFLYYNQGSYAKAEPLFSRALAIREKALGPDHSDTAQSLNNLAALYDSQGAYAKAEPLYRRALAIREKALGPDHPATASSFNNLAALYDSQGAYAKAEPLYIRALAINEKALGPYHPDTANSLNNLALLYDNKGSYAKAEALYRRALAIREKALGPDHPATATSLNNLALLYDSQGAYAKAEPFYRRALAINEKALGPDHPATATSLNNLAFLYDNQGAYAKAEDLYRRALAIREQGLGLDHPETANSLNNLAALYRSQGAYAKAEPLYLRSLAIREKVLGPDHPDTATSLNNLAELYNKQGANAKAEPLVRRALAIREKALGPDHPDTANSLNILAGLLESQGLYAKAEPLYLRALAIREKALGPYHPETALSLNNLAVLFHSQGDYVKAERLYNRALAISEKARGVDHPDTATSLGSLAVLYESQGAYAKAEPLFRRGIGIQSLFLQGQLPLLPQAARLAQVQALGAAWEASFSGADRSASAADLALFSRLNRYGLLLEIEQRQAQLGRAPGAPRKLGEEITALTTKLADAATPAAQRQQLGKRKEELERELYRLLPSLKPQLVEPAQVARVLPASSVLVEFQRFRPFDGRQKPGQQWGAPRYLALVLSPSGTTRAVDLGPADGIDPLIAQALAVSQTSGGDPTDLWKQVNSKVFPAPLLQLLAGSNQWILAPDGELSRIPFAALPSPRDPQRRLTNSVAVRLISSGRSLLPQNTASNNAPTRPLVLADPDFGPAPANSSGWQRLPATAKEGETISKLLQAKLYEQAAATTSVLTNAKGPALVHVASHGYYSNASDTPPPAAAAPPASGMRSVIAGLPASREDAMLNSGIVLAGANRSLRPDRAPAAPTAGSKTSTDDGYLTAKEAAQLQLGGTQLVVLSACDTAAGEQQSGEGLFGLQRALSVAGARTTLLSLWKVDDAATAYFMQRYYTLLQQGKGRMEALLAVQQEFRTDPPRKEWSDYRFWAAWQLVGDSGPIPGV